MTHRYPDRRNSFDLARSVLEEEPHLPLHLDWGPEATVRVTSLGRGVDFLGPRFHAEGMSPERGKRDGFLGNIAETACDSIRVRELLHGVQLRAGGWVKAYRFCAGPRGAGREETGVARGML